MSSSRIFGLFALVICVMVPASLGVPVARNAHHDRTDVGGAYTLRHPRTTLPDPNARTIGQKVIMENMNKHNKERLHEGERNQYEIIQERIARKAMSGLRKVSRPDSDHEAVPRPRRTDARNTPYYPYGQVDTRFLGKTDPAVRPRRMEIANRPDFEPRPRRTDIRMVQQPQIPASESQYYYANPTNYNNVYRGYTGDEVVTDGRPVVFDN